MDSEPPLIGFTKAGKLSGTAKGSIESVMVDITKDESVDRAVQYVKSHLKPGISEFSQVFIRKDA
ncbi:unnamed protein product [Anisakis simplex]|uniref:OsmC-like protein n=1 Tax=Anisakis simplex TaxID=6269 RepID=A0A0M3JPT7_ANISI|nr:unnamed protein product [Anisakis simplex]